MSYLRYLLLLDIHIFYHFANKRIPHALMVIKSRDLKQEISCSITIVLCKPFFSLVYSIQHYVIKFVSDLWQVGGFYRVLRFPS